MLFSAATEVSMGGVFKAYDIRGVYPGEVDERLAFAVGYHYRGILDAADLACGERVVVSHDMRSSSPRLAAALSDGLRTAGLAVHTLPGDWSDCRPGVAPLAHAHTARA